MNSPSIPTIEEITGPTPGQVLLRRILGHQTLLIGGLILCFIVLVAVLAGTLAPHDQYKQNLRERMIPPVWQSEGTWSHPLGTDQLGRDYLSRLMHGARLSLFIGFSAAFIAGIIGTAMGIAAGYFGGRVDIIITFLITLRLSMPVVLVALAVVALVGGSLRVVILVMGLMIWNRYAVVIRSVTMQIRNLDYVAAAQSVGSSTLRIILTEIIPNTLNSLVVVATLEIAHAILLEASLSFLGMGLPPPLPSWGLMVAEGKDFLFFEPWLITIPGVSLFLLVLSINLLGDGIRDVTAPEDNS